MSKANNTDLNWIIQSIKRNVRKNKDGNYVISGLEIISIIAKLYSTMDFEDEIPENDGLGLIRRSVLDLVSNNNLTHQNLKSEIEKQKNLYLNRPLKRYVIVAKISLKKPKELHKLYFGRTQIIFDEQLPNKYFKEEKQLGSVINQPLIVKPPNNYSPVRVHVTARSFDHAFNKGIETLDLFRGIWNLYINRRSQSFRHTFSGKTKPVNKIILGPIYFIHHTSGKLIRDNLFYYNPDYFGPVRPFDKFDYRKLSKYTEKIMNNISNSNYKKDLINSIIRYTDALDENDLHSSYLKLWALLEKLTDTIKISNEKTIERAAYLYKNHEIIKKSLNQLRLYRNKFVHVGQEGSFIESYLYELKNIVENYLIFYIDNPYDFKSFQEFGQFLSLPHEKNALKDREKKAKVALNFLYGEKLD